MFGDEVIQAAAWHGSAFIGASGGEIWRVWFGNDGQPLIERLTGHQMREYREAIDLLAVIKPADRT